MFESSTVDKWSRIHSQLLLDEMAKGLDGVSGGDMTVVTLNEWKNEFSSTEDESTIGLHIIIEINIVDDQYSADFSDPFKVCFIIVCSKNYFENLTATLHIHSVQQKIIELIFIG